MRRSAAAAALEVESEPAPSSSLRRARRAANRAGRRPSGAVTSGTLRAVHGGGAAGMEIPTFCAQRTG